jgi:hypothetical protein
MAIPPMCATRLVTGPHRLFHLRQVRCITFCPLDDLVPSLARDTSFQIHDHRAGKCSAPAPT